MPNYRERELHLGWWGLAESEHGGDNDKTVAKAKPFARWGRKAGGLAETVGLLLDTEKPEPCLTVGAGLLFSRGVKCPGERRI